MAKYLLACDCGDNVVVEDGQAGDRVKCVCGLMVSVPPLRQLRSLPTVKEPAAAVTASWSARQGVLSASLIAVALSAGLGGYFWLTSPKLQPFDPVAHMAEVDRTLDSLTPNRAWQMWRDFYRGLDVVGFTEYQPPHAAHIKAVQQQHRLAYTSSFSLAGVFLGIALMVAFLPGGGARKV